MMPLPHWTMPMVCSIREKASIEAVQNSARCQVSASYELFRHLFNHWKTISSSLTAEILAQALD